jgi:hypothetical protein
LEYRIIGGEIHLGGVIAHYAGRIFDDAGL